MPIGSALNQIPFKGSGSRRVPSEFAWYTPTKSAVSSIGTSGGPTTDSGHTVGTLAGAATAKLEASAVNSIMVMKAVGTGTMYLLPIQQLLGNCRYLRSIHRWDTVSSGTSGANNVGAIAWTSRGNTANSATHIVDTQNSTIAQYRTNPGAPTTYGDGSYSHGSPGGNWVLLEWAIDPTGTRGVVRILDGSVKQFNDALIGSYTTQVWPCWEDYPGTTGQRPEWMDMRAASVEGSVAAEIRFINDLLRAGGATNFITVPAAQPPPPPAAVVQAVGWKKDASATAAAGNVPFFVYSGGITGTTYTCTAGDLILVAYYNDDSSTYGILPSGYTEIPDSKAAVGGADSITVAYKIATGGEQSTGNAAAATAADFGLVCILSGSNIGVGNAAAVNGQSTTLAIPGVSPLSHTNGSSVVVSFAGRRTSTFGTLTGTPTGTNLIYPLDSGSVSGVASDGAIYVSNAAASFAGGSITASAGGSTQYLASSVEVTVSN